MAKDTRSPRFYRRRRTPPGTLIPDPTAFPPEIRVMAYGPEALVEETITDVSALRHFLTAWPVTWVNVDGLGNINVIQAMADHHRHPFHPSQLHRRGLRHEL